MLHKKIIQTYSKVHTNVEYTNDTAISFDGSQIQYEFFTAWECIEKYYQKNKTNYLSFLEIGAWKGLWGLAFTEFCKMHKIRGEYLTLTMIDQDQNNKYLKSSLDYIRSERLKANLVDMSTLSEKALPEILKYSDSFNIVFIDAAHDYLSVINDINKFAPLAQDLLIFHDIRPVIPTSSCGVYQAIKDLGIELDEEIVTHQTLMGIGIKYVNSNT